jgi:thymidylate kinase
MRGKFIVFEGIDGCGKTTQMKHIAQRLKAEGKKYILTCEPTSYEIGKLLRRYLSGEITADSHVIAALFAADRLDHILKSGGLLDMLDNDIYILCDRYYLSSYAYQSMDVDLDWIINLNAVSMEKLKPDCNIFIDITPETSLNRLKDRETLEIFEKEEKLKLIYSNYHKVIEKFKNTENIAVIDGNRSEISITEDIWNVIKSL